jgi:hypothetical protein
VSPDTPDWDVDENVRCVVCPDCAFTFDAVHSDTADSGTYSCPLCAEVRLEAEVESLRAKLAAADAVTLRLLDGWSPNPRDQAWERTPLLPEIERRRFADVPRGWRFRVSADGPWQRLNTEATFMWDRDAQVECTASIPPAWELMTDAEHVWLAAAGGAEHQEDPEYEDLARRVRGVVQGTETDDD